MESIIGAGISIGVLIVVAALVGVAAIVVVVPWMVIKAMGPSLERRIAARYDPEQIILKDLKALTFGLESRGVMQGRGNGALVLTADELCWLRFVPERTDLRLPLASITKVDTVTSHLGKSYGRSLLRVSFTNDGKPDSMAWYVPDLGLWLTKLGELVKTPG
jgi:hypothetical protein